MVFARSKNCMCPQSAWRDLAFATAFVFGTFVPLAVAGQAESSARVAGAVRKADQYAGMVTNQTVTVAGQDFYRYFVFEWHERGMDERFAIAIRERPSARWGTQISIEFAQRRIFQAQLPSSRAGIKALSEQAAEIAQQKVADAEVERLLFRDADIGPDEI